MRRTLFFLGAGALLGACLSQSPIADGKPSPSDNAAAVAPLAPPPRVAQPEASWNPMRSFAPLVESLSPSVAAIEVEGVRRAGFGDIPPELRQFFDPRMFGPQVQHGEGSGFVISADGLLVTNHHVVNGAQKITAKFADGRSAEAVVLGTDQSLDIALLQLPKDQGPWPHVKLAGDPKATQVGDWVVAMGNPLGLGLSVTAGIVSGKGRVIGSDRQFGSDDFLQTDAAINQGNSGGPLFNLDGEVVGVNSAIIAGANTVGFAIPAHVVLDQLEDLKTRGKVARGFLGVGQQDLDEALARQLGVPDAKGSLISEVTPGAPAEASGIQPGDVIRKIDEVEIDSPAELVSEVARRKPGTTVEVALLRNGKPKVLKVVLGERPSKDPRPRPAVASVEPEEVDAAGIGLSALSPQTRAQLGVPNGVLIETVRDGSPADGKLRPGDVILEVNRHPVDDPADVTAILERTKGNAFLLIARDDVQQFVVVPLP